MILPRTLVEALVIASCLVCAAQLQMQSTSSVEQESFEVVSIKPNKFGTSGGTQTLPNGERYINATLDILVKDAYGSFSEDQVIGMPSWAKSDRYDIELRVGPGTANEWKSLSDEDRFKREQPMLQNMLADRCKLKVHLETKTLPVYDLLISKAGLKMKEAAPGEKSEGRFSVGEMTGRAMTVKSLLMALPSDGRTIVDKTGLEGRKFDFDLKWTPENRIESGDSGPSLFTAIEEQLGLKLVSSKAPDKVLVVDQMERPSPN